MAQHAQLRIDTGLQVYFCDPQSPWQRGTNENTNGLLRQYFPKGTDLARHSADDLAAVAAALNSRPRKTLGWRTPAEVLDEHLAARRLTPPATTNALDGTAGAPAATRARLSPLRPALRASLRDDSHAEPFTPNGVRSRATVRLPTTRCCDDPLSPGCSH